MGSLLACVHGVPMMARASGYLRVLSCLKGGQGIAGLSLGINGAVGEAAAVLRRAASMPRNAWFHPVKARLPVGLPGRDNPDKYSIRRREKLPPVMKKKKCPGMGCP